MKFLRYLRIVISIFFFLVLFVSFLGIPFLFLPRKVLETTTFFQFIPSILKFTIVSTSLGFVVIILLVILFGRFYCSMICPLGFLQDIISRIGIKFRKRKIYRYKKPNNYVRYGILGLLILSLFTGSISLIGWFDPYSNFGRIISGTFRPLAIVINDGVAKLFEKANIYILPPIGLRNFSILALIISFALLVIIVLFSYKRGRLFCNTICPVGNSLGLLSRLSVFKIQIQPSNCTKCGKCSTKCKAECIDILNQKVDFDRCVGCYDCIAVCPENAIGYQYSFLASQSAKPIDNSFNSERRNFIESVTAGIIGAGLLYSFKAKANENNIVGNKIPVKKLHPVTPPGSQSRDYFTAHCTACNLCVSQCPTHVLKPSFLEYGISGMMMPVMSYSESFCNFECTVCTEVCPNGALLPIKSEEKEILQIGKVHFIRENCIVYTEETSCGACAEHCPTAAVHMVPYKGSLRIPSTNQDICVGCGGCEYACPAIPNKAIYVEGNPVHAKALKPKETEPREQIPEDFPF
jgi:ferredoxin